MLAHGTRFVETFPAGYFGNDQPFDVISEEWSSDELHLLLSKTDDDPRIGRTTMELEDLVLAEPDPALFHPPPGYALKNYVPPPPPQPSPEQP